MGRDETGLRYTVVLLRHLPTWTPATPILALPLRAVPLQWWTIGRRLRDRLCLRWTHLECKV